MQSITLPIELANALMQYLGNRPYVEVAGLIAEMQKVAADQKGSANAAE
jgi:hypothetical protein